MISTRKTGFNPDKLYAAVIDHAPDAILVFDLALGLVSLNEQACRQLGRSREEVIGKKPGEIGLDFESSQLGTYFRDRQPDGHLVLEAWVGQNGQDRIPLEIKASLIRWQGEQHILFFARDISEQRRIAKSLVKESVFMNALMENVPDNIFFKDPEGRWLRINRKLLNIVGASSQEEVVGKTDFDFYTREFADKTRADEQKILRTGEALIGCVEQRQFPDGRTAWTMVTKVPFRDPAGAIIGIAGISRDINEIKEHEERLRIKENQLSVASQIAGLGYWEYHRDEGMLTFNDHFYQVYGSSARELGGYKMHPRAFVRRFLHPEDRRRVLREMLAAQSSHRPDYRRQLEHRILYSDGNTGHVSVSFFVVKDEKGFFVKAFGVSQSITDRKLAEKAILESEAQLSMAARIGKLGYWEYDIAESLFTFNDQFYSMFKTSISEVGSYRIDLETYAALFLLPEETPQIFAKMEEAISQLPEKEHSYFEHRFRYGTEEIGYLAARFFLLRDQNGALAKIIGVNQDITDLKMAEKALAMTEAGLQKAFEVAAVGPYKFHFSEGRLEWSPMSVEVLGFKRDRIPKTAKEYLKLVHPDDVDKMKSDLKRELGDRAPDLEHRILIRGKVKWIRSRSHWEFDADGKPLYSIGVVQDITAVKRADKELQQYREHLEQLVSQRTAQLEGINKDLEAFAYSISHDLRAPLRHINGFANILNRRLVGANEEVREFITLIHEASMRMGRMIDGLLHFSRLGRQKLDTTVIDLNKLVREVIQHFAPDQLQRDIQWIVHPLPQVEGDYTLLKVVFENLISNAIKYTKNESPAVIEINTFGNDPNKPTIYIKDNGVGFDMKQTHKLFGVFQRLHRQDEFEGTGIGLANALQIIKKHGGDICAEGEVGVGATFYLFF
jgi:PAS domain S-box-containing protein